MDELPDVNQVEAKLVAQVIAATSPRAAALVTEHVEENFGEILPVILASDIARWWMEAVATNEAESLTEAEAAVRGLTTLHETANESLQTIVATGFLEALPSPHAEGREIVERLPASLREELQRMDNWTPN